MLAQLLDLTAAMKAAGEDKGAADASVASGMRLLNPPLRAAIAYGGAMALADNLVHAGDVGVPGVAALRMHIHLSGSGTAAADEPGEQQAGDGAAAAEEPGEQQNGKYDTFPVVHMLPGLISTQVAAAFNSLRLTPSGA